MEAKLTFKYDQESEELPDETIARLNPNTGEIENLEVLFFSTRLLRTNLFELPVNADLRLTGTGADLFEHVSARDCMTRSDVAHVRHVGLTA